jgi:putative membrane protein
MTEQEKGSCEGDRKGCGYVAASGLAMGAADVVPGVSGGTMAFILGIYGELLEAIKSVNLEFIRLVARGRFAAAFAHVNGKFLASLGAGLAASILSLSRVVTWLYEVHPVPLFSFFFGLILASIAVIGLHFRWRPATAGSLIAGAVIAYGIVRLVPVQMPHDPLTLFWCGAVAIVAMILPGISGSFILLILGQYHHVMSAVKTLDVITLLPFAAGAAIGLLLFARVLSWLLNRWHQTMISFLVGFMIGSLWKIWPFRQVLETMTSSGGKLVPVRESIVLPDWSLATYGLPLLLCLLGFGVVVGLDLIQKKIAAGHRLGG